MKSALKAILGLTVLTSTLPLMSFAGNGNNKSIYGNDNRMDFFAASADAQKLSDSVVSLWRTSQTTFDPASKTYTLATTNFGRAHNLCPSERFREQPKGALCSGALVGDDLVITAGHCIKDEFQCADAKLVFGFAVKTEGGQAPATIAQEEVYSCKQIIKSFQGDNPETLLTFFLPFIRRLNKFPDMSLSRGTNGLGADYSLIQLDRKVENHKALVINRSNTLKKGDAIFVIGHPSGLPLKVADGAVVRSTAPAGYFSTDLDTFNGNSGSPVFNATTNLVEGILVRGDTDFVRGPAGCNIAAVYPQNGGNGEDVTKISELQAFIPKLAVEKEAEAAIKAMNAVGIGGIDGFFAGPSDVSFQ